MNAYEVLDILKSSVNVDKESVDHLVKNYTNLYQTASDPIIVARAATNLGFALTLVPSTRFSDLLEYIKVGLAGLTDTFERVRIHFELGQLLTRTRKDFFYEKAREHYYLGFAELKQANVKGRFYTKWISSLVVFRGPIRRSIRIRTTGTPFSLSPSWDKRNLATTNGNFITYRGCLSKKVIRV